MATTSAVAMCVSCGAGLCLQHTLTGHQEEPVVSVGNPASRRLPGRRLFCGACAPAFVVQDAMREAAVLGAR